MKYCSSLMLALITGCAAMPVVSSQHFPELADRAAKHDPAALEQILALSAATSPGEQLEDLALLSASYVRASPTIFLQAQSTRQNCFGVSFLGPAFVDNQPARTAELASRREALLAIADPALLAARDRCLAELAGS